MHTVVIGRHRQLEGRAVRRISMVINHIHDDPNACLMVGLNHFLKLQNWCHGILLISSKLTIWDIIILRIIPPVIEKLPIFIVGFMVIKDRLQLDIIVTHAFEVIKTSHISLGIFSPFLTGTQVCPSIGLLNTRRLWDWEITEVHFTDNGWASICITPARFLLRNLFISSWYKSLRGDH